MTRPTKPDIFITRKGVVIQRIGPELRPGQVEIQEQYIHPINFAYVAEPVDPTATVDYSTIYWRLLEPGGSYTTHGVRVFVEV